MHHASDVETAMSPAMSGEIPRSPNTGSRFAGAVDYVEASAGIRGWLFDSAAPGVPPVIEMVCGPVRLARAYAMMDRPDIDRVVGRATYCGFLIGWSWVDVSALARIAFDPSAPPITFLVAETGERVPVVCQMPEASALLGLIYASPVGDREGVFQEVSDFREVTEAGLFDIAWYRARRGARLEPGMPPVLDYLRHGEAAGERPNFFFDPVAYAREWDLPSPAGALLHYIRSGGTSRLTTPHFDERWYRRRYDVPRKQLALAHYLAHRRDNAPNPFFDPAYYRTVSGEADLADPYVHFVTIGFPAGLMPSAEFVTPPGNGRLSPPAARYLEILRKEVDAAGTTVARRPEKPPADRDRAGKSLPPPPAGKTAGGGENYQDSTPARKTSASADKREAAPQRTAPALPPAAKLGYDAVKTWLKGLSASDLATATATAERLLEGAPAERADAALILAIAHHLREQPEAAAEASALYFAQPVSQPAEIAGATADRLLEQTHRLYERGRRDLADPVYRAAYHAGRRDQLVLLRLIEVGTERGEIDRLAPIAAEMEKRYGAALSPWSALALSRYYKAIGNRERAIRLLLAVPPFPQVPAAAEAAILHRLLEVGAVEEAAARAEISAADPSRELFAAHVRVAVMRRDAGQLLAALADPRANDLPGWQIAEAVFRLSGTGVHTTAEQEQALRALNRLAEMRGLEDLALVQARIQFLMHSKRWDELGALFEEIDNLPIGKQREVLLRRLEYYCQIENLEEAERIYRHHFHEQVLTKWEGLTIMRLLGELKRWDEAAAALLAHVGRGFGFGDAGHLGMRIVRKKNIHEAVIAAAEGVTGRREPDLDDFVARVREDLAILQTARALSANREQAARGLRYRSNWILDAGMEEVEEYGIFLCTNRRYFLSMLTFLCSFLGQAPQVGGRLFAFLDKDVPRHWHGAIAMVGARFGRSIEVVTEGEFVPPAAEHREAYGFFAAGGALSRAAYFRLYAARWLLARHRFRRAAYIDTDTICRGDLSGMFALDFGSALIAAATEDYTPDVVKAATRNDLDPRTYFNSGVLLFKFDDPELPAYIEEAIRISEQEQERLVFQDQCALNIAFRGRVANLPKRYNFFLRPSRERNGFIEDGLILHFLDKPKPWDVVFDRSYREEWRVWALFLGSILPQPLYVDIFAEANRD